MTVGTVSKGAVIRIRSAEELAWRVRRMTLLGADDALAAEVAASDVDVHAFERLLKDGCTIELAWSITQPLVEPPTPPASSERSEDAERDEELY